MPEETNPSPQRAPDEMSNILETFLQLTKSVKPAILHPGNIEDDRRPLFGIDIRIDPRPSDADGPTDWSVILQFPDTEATQALPGTPDVFDLCTGLLFYNIGYYDPVGPVDEIQVNRAEAGRWTVDSQKTTMDSEKVAKFITALAKN